MIRLDIGSASLVGQVRTANEDSFLVRDGLAVVADGMGGHSAGEVASAETVDALAEMEGSRTLDDLVRGVHLANRRIGERADADSGLRGMGTTVVVVGLVRREGADEIAVLNVGDSRVYLLADGELHQLTEDHSLVEELVREGRLTADEANVHPQKNVLTRALGVEPLVVVDAWLLSPREGDRLLLCSDGVTNELDDEQLAELLDERETPELTARRIAAEADAAGGRDNATAVVVDVLEAAPPPATPAGRIRRMSTPAVDLSEDDGHGPATETVITVVATGAGTDEVDDGEDDDEDGTASADGDAPGGSVAAEGMAVEGDGGGGDGDDHRHGDDGGQQIGDVASAPPPSEDDDITELATARGPEADADQLIAAQAEAEAATARAARWRTAAFLVAIVGVIALAVIAIAYTAGQGWYVTENDDGHVALYRGTPVLWLEPDEVEQAPQVVDDLTPADQATVRGGTSFSDEKAARDLIQNLSTTTTSTSTTTTTTTTTTAAPVPTTAPAAPAPAAPGP